MDNNMLNIISKVIDNYGKDVISEQKFINILNDYHAFNDNQPLKHIFKVIIDNGFASRWLKLDDNTNVNLIASRDSDIIVKQFGLKTDLVEDAIHIIFNVLGYISENDSIKNNESFFGKQRDLYFSMSAFQLNNECGNYMYHTYYFINQNKLYEDRYGILYSDDGKAVIDKGENSFKSYTIRKGTIYIANRAFSYDDEENVSPIHIKIPNTVVAIGGGAFTNANLSSVEIPDSVKHIGWDAFRNNNLIKKISLPENLEFIGNGAFSGTSIKSVILPENLKMIWGRNAFPPNTKFINESPYLVYKDDMIYNQDMTILFACFSKEKVIHIDNSVEMIGNSAFEYHNTIEQVFLGENIKRIGCAAFLGCENLKKVECNSKLEVIEFDAFCECYGLKSFTIPTNVRVVETGVFDGCELVELQNLSKHIEYIDGVLYNEECLIAYLGTDEKIVVREGTEIIGKGAFMNNDYIEKVVLPKSVLEIESHAFLGCSALKSINVNKRKCEVEKDAFEFTIFENKFNK